MKTLRSASGLATFLLPLILCATAFGQSSNCAGNQIINWNFEGQSWFFEFESIPCLWVLSSSVTGAFTFEDLPNLAPYVPMVGGEMMFYDNGTLIFDSGNQHGTSMSYTMTDEVLITTIPGHTYTVTGWLDVCYDSSGEANRNTCIWENHVGNSVSYSKTYTG
jgi:hypothetical protein